jgi:hypothetical protein
VGYVSAYRSLAYRRPHHHNEESLVGWVGFVPSVTADEEEEEEDDDCVAVVVDILRMIQLKKAT